MEIGIGMTQDNFDPDAGKTRWQRFWRDFRPAAIILGVVFGFIALFLVTGFILSVSETVLRLTAKILDDGIGSHPFLSLLFIVGVLGVSVAVRAGVAWAAKVFGLENPFANSDPVLRTSWTAAAPLFSADPDPPEKADKPKDSP